MVSAVQIITRSTILALLALLFSIELMATQVDSIRLWRAPDNTRLVFDLSGSTEYKVFALHNPERIVIDLNSTVLKANLQDLILTNSGISNIRHAVKDQSNLRVVLDLNTSMQMKSFLLAPNQQYSHRLVLDLFAAKTNNTQSVAPAQTRTTTQVAKGNRPLIIAIDAGHGGEDPGAIGPSKTKEKHIVLAIAKELYAELKKEPGFSPILIRTDDYYVSLQGRRDKAREQKADLFISIHADAFTNPAARGASVYALSQVGATSATARYLADRENATDIIGGVGGISLENKDDILRSVLVGMSMEYSLSASLEVGEDIIKPLGRVARLHKNTVEQAGFAVLKSPDIPSVLVETGFISNPTEEKNLGSRLYRQKLAHAIATGVKSYFRSNPIPGTWYAEQKSTEFITHRVASGDTLSDIAARYRISISQIRAINGLTSNSIRIGQLLKIPDA